MAGPPENFAWLLRSRRGYLATVGSDGTPHIFPVCFTWAGEAIFTAVDEDARSTPNRQRLADIQSNPKVSFTVDRWDEDWSRRAWLQARGKARIVPAGAESDRARRALSSKYNQYTESPATGPVIRIEVDRWAAWEPEV